MKIINPAFDYDSNGQLYSGYRRTDPRIAQIIYNALASAKTVLNVGAGTGSYEPLNKYVVAVEPSAVMRAQRLALHKVPAINAMANALPFDDNAFDASMATVTIHHWKDIAKGLLELRRVTREQVLILTFDPDALSNFWNVHYFPEVVEIERQRYPTIDFIKENLGGSCEVIPVPIPLDCVDGFQEAFYGRPEMFLQKEIRQAQSAWSFLPQGQEEKIVKRLANDLASGEWDKKYGVYRTMPVFTCALRLVVARP